MVDHSIPIVTLVEEIFGHARAGYAHAFFQVLLPSPQQFGLPIPLLSQFRSSIRQLNDKQLQELCDAIDFVKKSQALHPLQILSALQIHHPDPCELPDLAQQLHHRLLGILYAVQVASRIPERHNLQSLNTSSQQRDALLHSLHACGEHWDQAWQFPLQDNYSGGHRNGLQKPSWVDDFLQHATDHGWLAGHNWPLHATTWLTVRRLLMFLLEQDFESQPGPTETASQLLPVLWVRHHGNEQDGQHSPGVVRGIRLQKHPSACPGWFPDPVTFGVTLFDAAMQQSIEIAGRLAWATLRDTRDSICISPACLPQIPSTGFCSPLLTGGSAGGLIGCGLYALISGQSITAGLTASVALGFRTAGRRLLPADRNLNIRDIVCVEVGGAEFKLEAAAAAGLRGTALHKKNEPDASRYLSRTQGPRCRPEFVDDFQQLIRYLTRGFQIDQMVAAEATGMLHNWTSALQGQPLLGYRHGLDVFVQPRVSVRLTQPADHRQQTADNWETLPAGVQVLLDKHFMPAKQWLVIHEDAGGGKTVLSWLLAATLCQCPQRPWVVRYEGQEFPDSLYDDLINKLLGKTGNDTVPQAAPEVLQDLLEQRRVVVIYDAHDQDRGSAATDAAADEQRTRKLRTAMTDDRLRNRLRLILTSRPYALRQHQVDVFGLTDWLECRLELFDERQQSDYRRQVIEREEARMPGCRSRVETAYRLLLPQPDQVADLLRYPAVQAQLRLIIQEQLQSDGSTKLRSFKNAGDLYLEITDRLLDRAFKSGVWSEGLQDKPNLMEILACYGYMMLLRYRDFRVIADDIPQIHSEVERRFRSPAHWERCSKILVDTFLTEHLLLKENAPRELSFPSLKMAEFFAALYLGRYCDARVISELQPQIGLGEWDRVWRFVAELPETTNRQGNPVAVPASLSCSLQALFAVPDEGRERPTESMFRAWQVLQRNTWLQQVREPVLAGWRHQFRRLLIDGYELGRPTTRARTAAEVLLDGDLEIFVRDAVVFEQRQLKPRLRELRADDLRDADQQNELSLLQSQWDALNNVVTSVQDWCQSLRPDFTTYALCSDDKTGHAERLTFMMGASKKDNSADARREQPWQEVTVPSFYMATACVTRAQYALFDPQREREHNNFDKYAPEPDCPMIYVNFFDGICFALWLGDRYSLPSEVQWEGAAWGGLDRDEPEDYVIGVPPCTADFTPAQVHINGTPHKQNPNWKYWGRTVPVRFAKFQPNGFGLWQMSGNVREYTRSEWHERLQDAIGHKDDDLASGSAEPGRCVRGGSWGSSAGYARCSYRFRNGSRSNDTGIRLSRTK